MVNKQNLEHVSNLASIEIEEDKKEFFAAQLSKIINYIDKLKELDVRGVEPMRGLHVKGNVFREDKVKDFIHNEDILQNAPLSQDGYFKIPKVID
ncbi:MAG: Asp-tRNA(Asn)/Glu-tRNA(Gln) amidotransferase subunit GatC [Candidatus Omnitrophica bacterium]|nr:Asp-tRNA(Asn)/Glu-tRNA(Gln) amidotransferase subunit GatC [Candidatus Omnitrophota bacterium]